MARTLDFRGQTLQGKSSNVAATPYAVVVDDSILCVNTGAARTINIPTAGMRIGRILVVKDTTGTAFTNNITIQTDGAETIDGADTCLIAANYGYATLISDGTNWYKGPCLLV